MTTTDELHTLTGAYVLDALETDEEREAFERHLAQCAPCAHEVRELSETTARLGLAVAAPIDPALRAEVLRRIVDVRQFPPPPGPSAGRRAVSGAAAAAPLGARRLGRRSGGTRRGRGVAVRARRGRRPARGRRGGAGGGGRGRPRRARRPGLHGPARGRRGGHPRPLPVPGPGGVRRGGDAGAAAREGLPALVRRLGDDAARRSDDAGRGDLGSPPGGPANRSAGIGITVEPAGGSPRPTSDPVATMAMPAA